MGPKGLQLIVGTTKGCRDTITKTMTIVDKPPMTLSFRDTLICVNDKVQLVAKAEGGGNFTWSPGNNIQNATSASPLASPTSTTTYYVLLDDNGCLNKDSIKVRVTDKVFLQAMNDTTICAGDPIQLKLKSDGFTYAWTNISTENAALPNPNTAPVSTTIYEVTAFIGGCSAKDQVRVTTVPYPIVNAGVDTVICNSNAAQLSGITNGSSVVWSPAATLIGGTTLDPVARPKQTTSYILTAFDTKGCPKPSRDTVLVTVLPTIKPFAGRDTSVVIGQPLQLNATGGVSYSWSPSIALSATDTNDPIAVYSSPSEGIEYKVLVFNEAGCADSAYINVKVFATKPLIFVPNAFTPNGDGKNDKVRPIAAGMLRIEYFNVYNRWGQLVFSTQLDGQGWDGTIGGKIQNTGVFTWAVKAIDYSGKPYFEKGIVTLIR
jgi:gliding motility-associated-like protein